MQDAKLPGAVSSKCHSLFPWGCDEIVWPLGVSQPVLVGVELSVRSSEPPALNRRDVRAHRCRSVAELAKIVLGSRGLLWGISKKSRKAECDGRWLRGRRRTALPRASIDCVSGIE